MVKIAIVGIGYWGKNLVRVFSEMSDIVACVHNGNKENKEWIKRNYPGIDVTTDYNQIASNPEVDAIVIATPIGTHYELVKKALLENKHVFVEKPLAENPEKAKHLSDLAKRKNQFLFVGYIFVHHPTIQPLFDRSTSTPIVWCRFEWEKFGDLTEDIFLDVVSHPVAVGLALFNENPKSVDINYSKSVTGSTDIVSADLQFGESIYSININRLAPIYKKSLHILFEDGELFYWGEEALYKFDKKAKEYLKKKESNREPLQTECQQFISIINKNTENRKNRDFGYRVNKIIKQVQNKV